MGVRRSDLTGRGVGQGYLGKAEIENLGVSAFGDKNIRGLDVAVNDALGVRGVERVGDFDGEREYRLGLQRTAADLVF
jgi:hypothetical protein